MIVIAMVAVTVGLVMVAAHDDKYWGAFQLVSRTRSLEVPVLLFTCFHDAFVMQAA